MADYILDRFTAADDALIHGRTTETGETWTAQVSAMKIASNRATCSSDGVRAIATVPTSWADVSVEANVRIANIEAGYVGIVLRWTDSNNYWMFRILAAGGNGFRLYEVNGGVETLRAFDNPAFDSDSDITVRAVASGTTITVTGTQGATSLQIQYASASHNQSATTHGIMLEKAVDSINDILMWQGSGAPPANPLYSAITLTSPAALQVFQRDGAVGAIAIVGSFSGGGTHDIEASFNGGAYATIGEGSTGAFSGTLSGQAQGQGTVTVRFVDDTGVTATANNVGIGDVFVLAGQSNMSGRGTDAQSWSHDTLYASQFGNNYAWAQLAAVNDSNVAQVDAVSSDANAAQNYIPRLATAIMADQDVPVAFVPCAMGATAIASWLPGADHQDRTTLYGSMVYRALAVGGVKAVIFHQGESDATVNSFTGGATYKSRLKTLASAVYDDLGVPLVVCRIHCWSGAPDTSQANVNEINAAMAAAAAEDSHILLGANFDSPTPVTTSLHFTTDAELTDAAARLWSALDALFYTVVAGKTEPAIRLAAVNNYWSLNDYLVLAAQSFDGGGSIVHLDAAPYFVIYNAATGALVASGSTSAIDNTVGLYVARVQLTTAAGFATGANYVVRVTANLDGKTLADLAVFNAGDPWSTAAAAAILAAADATPIKAALAADQGAVTFGQVKILADINYEGALHIDNNALNGVGLFAHGTLIGQHNHGNQAGQYNQSSTYGQYNNGDDAGQYNEGDIRVVGAASQEIADALKRAPAAGTPAVGSAMAQLAAILEDTGTTLPTAIAAIEPGGGSYAGDGTGYYSDTIDDGTSPLDGVRVQLYTSPNRVGPAYEAYTNALGVFEMWPDPGTYYRWLDYAGVSFAQDVAVTVTEP